MYYVYSDGNVDNGNWDVMDSYGRNLTLRALILGKMIILRFLYQLMENSDTVHSERTFPTGALRTRGITSTLKIHGMLILMARHHFLEISYMIIPTGTLRD